MRKIRLNVDELAVESFRTAASEGTAGTVQGQGFTAMAGCVISGGVSACATCDGGCPQDTSTCFASCQMTNGYQKCIGQNC